MAVEMLINTVEGQESRIAILDEGRLEELYIERASSASQVGNIYKGRVTNVEPSIQAAFVDFGGDKNGFLHISDVHVQYFPKGRRNAEPVGRKKPQRERPPIQDCLHRGQEVIVQMTKQGIGTKGPTLTTYLSLPGRLLVMMPGMSKLGVSRKIEDMEARLKARKHLSEMNLPPHMGFIVRTAGLNRTKRELHRDLKYLLRLWKTINQRSKNVKAPAEIYQESDLVIRTIRDVYTSQISRIVCDSESVAWRVREFLRMAVPRSKQSIELYTGKEGLFHEFGVEQEIEKIYSPRVELPSGGSLVIDQAEALVAIDINSGRFREHLDAETTAVRINTEAAREIARQLRLRDLGGVIVIDFIDMNQDRNRRAVERTLRDALKSDRAKIKVLRMSAFAIVEMTRQRVRPPLKESIYRTCSHCDGLGVVKSEESQALQVLRNLQRAASHPAVHQIDVTVTPAAALYLSNYFRRLISRIEADTGKRVVIRFDTDLAGDQVNITCTNNRGSEIAWEHPRPGEPGAKGAATVSLAKLEEARRAKMAAKAEAAEAPEAEPQPHAPPAPEAKKTGKRRRRRAAPKGRKEAKPAEVKAPEPEAPAKAKKPARRRKRTAKKKTHRAAKSAGEAPTEAQAKTDRAPKAKKSKRSRRRTRKAKKTA
jgi:ribonuclease E